jgi:hypothetical protein
VLVLLLQDQTEAAQRWRSSTESTTRAFARLHAAQTACARASHREVAHEDANDRLAGSARRGARARDRARGRRPGIGPPAHEFPLGTRTRDYLDRQRSGEESSNAHGLTPPAERRARKRYLQSFEHPIPTSSA